MVPVLGALVRHHGRHSDGQPGPSTVAFGIGAVLVVALHVIKCSWDSSLRVLGAPAWLSVQG